MYRTDYSEQAIQDLHIDFRAIEDVSGLVWMKLISVWPLRTVVMYERESQSMGWTAFGGLDR